MLAAEGEKLMRQDDRPSSISSVTARVAPGGPPPVGRPARPEKVLVVDDEPAVRRMLARVLRHLGFQNIDEAPDGLVASQLFASGVYQVVISDWEMPGLDGLHLLRAIRASENGGDTPVFLMSGRFTNERERAAMEAGADGCFEKPFSVDELGDTVLRALDGRRMAGSSTLERLLVGSDDCSSDGPPHDAAMIRRSDRAPQSGTFAIPLRPDSDPSAGLPVSSRGVYPRAAAPLSKTLLGPLVRPPSRVGPEASVDVDPRELVAPLFARFRRRADAKQVDLMQSCSLPSIRVKPQAFSRALSELIENALEASSSGHPVLIDMRETGDGDSLVQVQDVGCGMSRATLLGIGEPPSMSPTRPAGFGILMARSIIDDHRGVLHFDSAPGVGTTATVWLPRGVEARARPAQS